MEQIVLKKSCDSCTASKVKCTGGNPCERCTQKSLECFYSPRKRRSKPKKQKLTLTKKNSEDKLDKILEQEDVKGMKPMYAFDQNNSVWSLLEWERRSWSVFFTLYKHYGTSCSLFWFNNQLNKMRNYLSRQGNKESLKRLTSWMSALNIDMEAVTGQISRCKVKCEQYRATLSLKVGGKVDSRTDTLAQASSPKVPFIKIINSYPRGYLNDEDSFSDVEVNEAFTKVFGIQEQALKDQLKWTAGGFLPWGGDIIARLLTREKDVLAFVQIIAIKYNTLGKPTCIPTVREVPSCHMFEVNIRENEYSSKLKPAMALIKVMHREILERQSARLEISIEITPTKTYEHLLGNNLSVEETLFGEEEYAHPCRLSCDRNIVPFSTKRKRIREGFDDDDESKVDLFSLPGFDDVDPLGDPLENQIAASATNTTMTTPSSVSTFATDHYPSKQQVIQQGLKEYEQKRTVEDNIFTENFLGEQTEWLDGLLDWANKQELQN